MIYAIIFGIILLALIVFGYYWTFTWIKYHQELINRHQLEIIELIKRLQG